MRAVLVILLLLVTGLAQQAVAGRAEFVGPVGKGTLNPHAYDKEVMTRLWSVSEEATNFSWSI